MLETHNLQAQKYFVYDLNLQDHDERLERKAISNNREFRHIVIIKLNITIMKRIKIIYALLFLFNLSFCQKNFYQKFDSALPGLKPQEFASGIISKDKSYVGYCAFDHIHNDFYYCITDANWGISKILKINAHNLTKIDTLNFGINEMWEGEPFISADGNKMFFTSITPPVDNPWHGDIFYVTRKGDEWGEPKEVSFNTLKSEWHISVASNGNIYFGSERETDRLKADIYMINISGGEADSIIKLTAINSDFNDCDPLIAPDEKYLIFHSDRPGGYGEHDLYVAFNKNGHWTTPINMGPDINSEGWEMAPTLTPDGKFLLFTRRKAFQTDEPSKIYWVNIDIINALK